MPRFLSAIPTLLLIVGISASSAQARPSTAPASGFAIRDCKVMAKPQGASFDIALSEKPDTSLALGGWPLHEFQFYVWPSTTNGWNPPQGDVVIRGWEPLAGGIAIRDVGPEPDPSPYSGGWGPLRGVVPFVLAGPTIHFVVPWSMLGDDDGLFAWQLIVTEDGALTDLRRGATDRSPKMQAGKGTVMRASGPDNAANVTTETSWGALKWLYR